MKKIAPCVLIKVITTKPEQNTKEQPYGKDYNTDSGKFHQKDIRKYQRRELQPIKDPVKRKGR